MNRTKIHIFWTGGYDSTYRMAELSKLNIDIQPYYINDHRAGESNELYAIEQIAREIRLHPETKCTILPLITFNREDIPEDIGITQAWQRINKATKLGSQYDWLARFIKYFGNNERFEYSLEWELGSKAYNTIDKFGKTTRIKSGNIEYLVIDPEKSSKDLLELFGQINLPLPLFELTKKDLLERYSRLHLENLIPLTWFCHTPSRKGLPCGICSPCQQVIDAGIEFRLPKSAIRRNKLKKYVPASIISRIWHKFYIQKQ